MTTLTSSDYRDIKKRIRRDPTARSEFKIWGLDKPTWYALFQTVEDWFVNGFSTTPTNSFKAAIESVTGATTNARAKVVGFIWMGWRYQKNP